MIGLPRFQTMINHHGPQYHRVLVSPHIGGRARVAFEIHKYAAASRGPVSQLLIPGGREAAWCRESFLRILWIPFGKLPISRSGKR